MSRAPEAERAFDELSVWVAAELTKVRGDAAAEDAVLTDAVKRFAEARTLVDPSDPYSHATHFFGADGAGWKLRREPGLQRVTGATPEELARWAGVIAAVASKLEAALFAD